MIERVREGGSGGGEQGGMIERERERVRKREGEKEREWDKIGNKSTRQFRERFSSHAHIRLHLI